MHLAAGDLLLHPGKPAGVGVALLLCGIILARRKRANWGYRRGLGLVSCALLASWGAATIVRGARDCYWSLVGLHGATCMDWWDLRAGIVSVGVLVLVGSALLATASLVAPSRRTPALYVLTPMGLFALVYGIGLSFAAVRFAGWLSPLLASLAAGGSLLLAWQHDHPEPPGSLAWRFARALLGLISLYLLLGLGGEQLYAAPLVVPASWAAARHAGRVGRWFFIFVGSLYASFVFAAAAWYGFGARANWIGITVLSVSFALVFMLIERTSRPRANSTRVDVKRG